MRVLGGLGLGYDANLYRLYIQKCPWWRQSETTKMRGRVNHNSGPKLEGEGCHASASKPENGQGCHDHMSSSTASIKSVNAYHAWARVVKRTRPQLGKKPSSGAAYLAVL